MPINRRIFLKKAAVGGGLLMVPGLASASSLLKKIPRLTILHTNDWHSHIDPFPDDGGRNANQGGAIRPHAHGQLRLYRNAPGRDDPTLQGLQQERH